MKIIKKMKNTLNDSFKSSESGSSSNFDKLEESYKQLNKYELYNNPQIFILLRKEKEN